MNSEQFYRLTVLTTNIAPAFKVMLYPFAPTDPIPTNVWTSTNSFNIALAGQTDTFNFSPRNVTTTDGRTVTLSEFQLTRGSTNLMDYRNQIEPFASVIAPQTPPVLSGVNLTGTNLIFTGTNGAAGANYLVLTTTNLQLTATNWTILSTNQFGPGGAVNFTNSLDPARNQLFYRLLLP
jgi:hypothetical protein